MAFVLITSPTGSNTTISLPADWNPADNSVECIGAGARGAHGSSTSTGGGGGGGGAYTKIVNCSLAANASVTVRIGAASGTDGGAGGDTWFNDTVFPTTGANKAGAKGGAALVSATTTTGGIGGAASAGYPTSGTGLIRNNGGTGGLGVANTTPGGGGGAGGPAGAGVVGNAGNAGTNPRQGGAGNAGSGGAGGVGTNTASPGAAGGAGTGLSGGVGAGGGGGGSSASPSTGGAGGLYGAGGAGGGRSNGVGGAGAQGIVILTYTPIVIGDLALPQAAQTLSAAASIVVSGTLNAPQANTLSAAGGPIVAGALTGTRIDTIAAAGGPIVGGILSLAAAPDVLSGTGTVASGSAPLDGLSGVTGAWSMSRKLLSAYGGSYYTDTGSDGTIDIFNDQAGSARNFAISGARPLPTLATAGGNSRACARFNGVDQTLQTAAALSSFITATDGYLIASFIPRAITTNDASEFNNDLVVGCSIAGIFLNNGGGTSYAVRAYNYTSSQQVTPPDTISLSNAYVYEWWHTGGVLYGRLNGGTTQSISAGNTGNLAQFLFLGRLSGTVYTEIDLFELAALNTVPTSGQRDALVVDFKNWVEPSLIALTGQLASLEVADSSAIAGPVTKTFFNPARTSTSIVLSNTNLTATQAPPAVTGTMLVTEAADTAIMLGPLDGTMAVTEAADIAAMTDASGATIYLVTSFSPVSDRTDFAGGEVGMQFTCTANMTFNKAGLCCRSGNTGNHIVRLYSTTSSEVLLRTITIDLTGGTAGVFYYASMSPITLASGTQYALLTEVTATGQAWANEASTTLINATGVASSYRPPASAIVYNTADLQFAGVDLSS